MKKIIILFIIFIFYLYPAFSRSADTSEERRSDMDKKIVKLLEEYKELKKQKSHFNGGEWNNDLDSWNGKLHNIMADLGDYFGKNNTEENIINSMGEPDSIEIKGKEKKLIYFWRGWHDYLYFICKDGTVKYSEWYFAFE